ncbi:MULTISPECIES: ABC transporter ATP-binding protein [Peptoniphilus]|uniref:ABC transporter ATP-binding protein n=1 Tax=Peptoniphilus TaxID=162289 RepID=UPI0001DCA4FD|nr:MULTISPECIES: ABC transporter ATP-binding protein [Peptoniphilus]EFK39153.1 ABC transporter, ATP-binding protein [Peptoniphilus sp. oral taxon 836 str. F0141]KGF31342.1 amino acid ABC transporter ATPase [Peptoniphilus lacrimalis DNF00528]MDK8281539.1 ABC transporter ATP-binding protein [Peptoniphilus lacrimalis]
MLKVNKLDVYYGNIHAIKEINFHVEEGETICLVGANGAGKTTTLQSISGLIPKSGKLEFMGKNISKLKANQITALGIAQVPEGRRVFTGLSVYDNLHLGSFLIKEDNTKILNRIYQMFPILEERKNQLAGTLSGGEQQMLAMGRALMSRPKLLLLDEPSMGLSPLYVEKIFKVIEMLREEKITMLLVEQNANLALEVSDRAYVLETGKIVKEGSAKELKNDPTIKTAYLGE